MIPTTNKYKLLRDLPGIEAGKIIETDGHAIIFPCISGGRITITRDILNNFPDFFEPLNDKWPKDIKNGHEKISDELWLMTIEAKFKDRESASAAREFCKSVLDGSLWKEITDWHNGNQAGHILNNLQAKLIAFQPNNQLRK